MKCLKFVLGVCVLLITEAHVFCMEQKQQSFAVPCISGSNGHSKKSVPEQLLLLIEEKMAYAFKLMNMYQARYEIDAYPDLIQQGICTALSPQTCFHKDLLAIKSQAAEVDWSFVYTTTFEWYLKKLIYKLFGDFIAARFVELDKLYEWIMKDIQYQIACVEKSENSVPISGVSQLPHDALPVRCVSAGQVGVSSPFSYLTENLLPERKS